MKMFDKEDRWHRISRILQVTLSIGILLAFSGFFIYVSPSQRTGINLDEKSMTPPLIHFTTNQTDRIGDDVVVWGNIPHVKSGFNYTYEEDGFSVTKSSNGTIIKQERPTGLFRNSSVTTYYEYRGLATIRYPHTPRNYVTYQQITNESRDADLITVMSLLENLDLIESKSSNTTYFERLKVYTFGDLSKLEIRNLRSDESKSFKFFNRTFMGRVEVTASLILLDTADMTYEVRDLKIVAGSTQHKLIVEWKWLILQEQR